MTTLDGAAAPQTRMLLASDGSTTTLLQALLGEELRLRLDGVAMRSGRDVPEATRVALGIHLETPVLVRRSALLTSGGLVVSLNLVVARAPVSDVIGRVLTGGEPIGRIMNGSRAGHRRLLLDSGWDWWDADGEAVRCAFKAYVIVEDAVPAIHVFERFNPRIIPAAGVPPEPDAGAVPRQRGEARGSQ